LLHKPDRHLCATCWSAIPPIAGNHPLYEETRARLLASGALSGLAAVYVFTHEGPFQSLAHALKYSGFRSIGTMLGQRLGEEMVRRGVTADVIIPMPLHTVRRRERGFNQAEVIARAVSLRIGIPLDVHLLHRVRNTGSQTKLHRHERMKNVEGAFRVSPDRQAMLEKKSSLLIDDVITTGATVISAATALREAGAAGIFAAAAALAE
jgi:ComF family protein